MFPTTTYITPLLGHLFPSLQPRPVLPLGQLPGLYCSGTPDQVPIEGQHALHGTSSKSTGWSSVGPHVLLPGTQGLSGVVVDRKAAVFTREHFGFYVRRPTQALRPRQAGLMYSARPLHWCSGRGRTNFRQGCLAFGPGMYPGLTPHLPERSPHGCRAGLRRGDERYPHRHCRRFQGP